MLKLLFLIALVGAGAWWWSQHGKEAQKQAAKIQNQAVGYTNSLQKDVQKAEDAQQKANAAIKQETQAVGKALKDAEGQNQ